MFDKFKPLKRKVIVQLIEMDEMPKISGVSISFDKSSPYVIGKVFSYGEESLGCKINSIVYFDSSTIIAHETEIVILEVDEEGIPMKSREDFYAIVDIDNLNVIKR